MAGAVQVLAEPRRREATAPSFTADAPLPRSLVRTMPTTDGPVPAGRVAVATGAAVAVVSVVERTSMRVLPATVLVLGALGAAVGCGAQEPEAPVALPPSGTAYRALNDGERLAVAASCRDRAATSADGVAADELEGVDPQALRDQLDAAFRLLRNQPRPVADLCAKHLPFVTPGLRLSFDGARDSGDTFTYETDSDKPLTIRGAVSPPRAGTVTMRREFGSAMTYRRRIGPDGRFVMPTQRLRKVANNSFILSFDAPPGAPRKAYFSAICLDCLAGGPPPSSGQ